jgi:hypothetical protein
VALLAAFSQMGLKLRVDMPQQSLEIAKIFFRNSTPANEAAVSRLRKKMNLIIALMAPYPPLYIGLNATEIQCFNYKLIFFFRRT